MNSSFIRNIAIIAHVDHGKTTLIDGMLKQTRVFRENQHEMQESAILDTGDLEREKGITILAKNTAVFYKNFKINIIDTPGHADFAQEVERVINMADGALLIVDAAEGPLAQTRFVLEQAFKKHLKIIVLINKIDKKQAEPIRVLREIEELFLDLATDESQLEFPVLYGIGRQGKVWKNLPNDIQEDVSLKDLFETIIDEIPAPICKSDDGFLFQIANIDHDSYKGFYLIGKVLQGSVKEGDTLNLLRGDKLISQVKVAEVFTSRGLEKVKVEKGICGDIVYLTGIKDFKIGDTLASLDIQKGLPPIKVSEPTLKITIFPNSSPFAGREGEFCTARQLKNRLEAEQKLNLGLKLEPLDGGGFIVSGRGELHLAVLIETMRREGYEMEVSRPKVILKTIDGKTYEPYEELTIHIQEEFMGVITEEIGKRNGVLKFSKVDDKNVAHFVYEIPSKNLIGFRSSILTKTKGNGTFAMRFIGYKPYSPYTKKLRNGVIIASQTGTATAYALKSLEQRGVAFIGPKEEVYEGMIVGISKTYDDLEMNVCKAKKLTNFRSNAEVMVVLAPPKKMSLEQYLDFLEEDELLEVTPKSLRLRKRLLDKKSRIKALKKK